MNFATPRAFWKDPKGSIAPIAALLALPTLGLIGLSLDYSSLKAGSSNVQAEADAAALQGLHTYTVKGLSVEKIEEDLALALQLPEFDPLQSQREYVAVSAVTAPTRGVSVTVARSATLPLGLLHGRDSYTTITKTSHARLTAMGRIALAAEAPTANAEGTSDKSLPIYVYDAPYKQRPNIELPDGRLVMWGRKWDLHVPPAPYALKVAQGTSPRVRFEVRNGDYSTIDLSQTSNRSELSMVGRMPMETEWWTAFDVMVEGAASSSDIWTVIAQVHDDPDKNDVVHSPPLEVTLVGPDLVVATRSDTSLATTKNFAGTPVYRVPNFRRNQFHRFVFRMKFSKTGHGQLEIWQNGVSVFSSDDIPMGFNNATSGDYLKLGVYRKAYSGTLVVTHANAEAGTAPLFHRISLPADLRPEY